MGMYILYVSAVMSSTQVRRRFVAFSNHGNHTRSTTNWSSQSRQHSTWTANTMNIKHKLQYTPEALALLDYIVCVMCWVCVCLCVRCCTPHHTHTTPAPRAQKPHSHIQQFALLDHTRTNTFSDSAAKCCRCVCETMMSMWMYPTPLTWLTYDDVYLLCACLRKMIIIMQIGRTFVLICAPHTHTHTSFAAKVSVRVRLATSCDCCSTVHEVRRARFRGHCLRCVQFKAI